MSNGSSESSARAPRVTGAGTRLIGGIFLFGLCATLLGYLATRQREKREDQANFESRVRDASSDLFRHFEIPIEVALSLSPFMGVVPGASHSEFTRFAAPTLERHPGIAALEWAPRVKRADRADFERRVAEIWETDGEGRKVRSPDRPELFPLTYIVPDAPTLRGLEIAFDDARRAMVERAERAGKPVLSPPFRLVEDPEGMMSVSILSPVTASAHARMSEIGALGFAICLFRLQPVADEALIGSSLENLFYSLYDDTDPRAPILLATNRPKQFTPSVSFEWDKTVMVLNREWRVSWRGTPTRSGPVSVSAWVLGLGIFFTTLVSVSLFLLLALRGSRQREEQAARMGSYTLTRRLGEGGMGVVYEAEHSLLRRRTAVKLIREDAATELSLERFEREVQATSRLTHPNTVQLFDYGRTPAGVFYYAMEYIDGLTLRDLVEVAGPLPPSRAVHLMKQAVGALAEAHELGMVHRDLKPDNMMVCDRGGIADFVKVLDFGLVKNRSFDQHTFITQEHAMVGTPEYMAPEAFSGGAHLTAASDVYGLGSVLYFLLTGAPPHTAPNLMALVVRVSSTAPVAPEFARGEPLPEELSALVMACLNRDMAQRPKDARALLCALENLDVGGMWTAEAARSFWLEWGPKFEARAREHGPKILAPETADLDDRGSRRNAG